MLLFFSPILYNPFIILSQGPDPLSSDEPARVFGDDLTPEKQRQLVIHAYKKLKDSFEEFNRPNGDQNNPAKTCRDLNVAHPDLPSGEVILRK